MVVSLPLWQRPGSSPGLAKFHLDGPGPSRALDPLPDAAWNARPKRVRPFDKLTVFGSADGRSESRVRDCKALSFSLSAGPKRPDC